MTTNTQSNLAWRVGLAVILAALGLGVLLFLTGNYHLFEDGYQLHVTFNYARGIEVGAPVLVSGVKLGIVEDVDFVYHENQSRVRLKLWIQKKALIKKDSKIYVKTLGLMGQTAIEITTGSPTAQIVSANEVMDGEEPFVAEEVLAAAQEVTEGLSKAVQLFNSILEEAGGKQKIRAMIENMTSASAEVDRTVKDNAARIDAIARSIEKAAGTVAGLTAKGSKDIDSSLEDLKTSSAELRIFLQKNRPKADEFLTNLVSAGASLDKAVKDVRAATEKMAAGKSAAGVVFADENSAKHVRNILKNLDDLSQDIRDHPWKLLRKP